MNTAHRLTSDAVDVGDGYEAANDYLYEHGFTDGLPIVPPTEERVRRFVDYMRRPPSDRVGAIPPAGGDATIEKLAVNAVMAGCRAEYLPVLVAAVDAMCDPAFNLFGIQVTTSSVGPMLIVNGPARHSLKINCAAGVMGPGWRANATIGRAARLVLLNLGSAKAGDVDKSTQGFPGKYTLCIGELEEESPWEPLHVERGFGREESTVTVLGAQGTANVVDPSPRGKDVLHTLTLGMNDQACNNYFLGKGEPLALLCPMHARLIAAEGFARKAELKGYLFEKVRAPLSTFSEAARDKFRREPGRIVDGMVPLVNHAEDILIAVAGGAGGLHSCFIPTFGESRSITRRIVFPEQG